MFRIQTFKNLLSFVLGIHVLFYRGFACLCHKSGDDEELCRQFLTLSSTDDGLVTLCRGGAAKHHVKLSEWKLESARYFDRFFSKRQYDIICVPQQGDIVLKTLKEWVQDTQQGSKQGALIVQNINFLEQSKFLKTPENNFRNSKNAINGSSCYLVFNHSENIIIYLRKAKDVNGKENLKEEMKLCISDIHQLIYLYQDELKESGVRIVGLVISNNQNQNVKLYCEFCYIFVVSTEIFQNLNSFQIWLEKSDTYFELSDSDLLEGNKESFSLFCQKMLSLMACSKCTHLPNFTNSVISQIDQLSLLLTPAQMDIIYSSSKYTILKGNFGTGKTIVLQKKLQNLAEKVDKHEVIYYFNYDRKSNAIIFAKNFIEKNCSEKLGQIKARENHRGLKLSGIFSSILEEVEREVKSVHVFIDEFNGADLTSREIEILRKNLENKYFKESIIFIAAQPVETERIDTFNDQPKIHKSEANLFNKLADIFEIEHLTQVMRTTVEVNTVMKVMQIFLESRQNEFTHKAGSETSMSSQKRHSLVRKKPNEVLDFTAENKIQNNTIEIAALQESPDKTDKQIEFLHFQGHVKQMHIPSDLARSDEEKTTNTDVSVPAVKSAGEVPDLNQRNNNLKSIMDGIDDLDQAFKQAAEVELTHEESVSGSKTISSYKFISQSEIGHQIKSSNPKLIIPHQFDSDFESAITYSAVLDSLDVAKKRAVIIHFEEDAPPVLIKALKILSRPYTDDVKYYMTNNSISILVTNFRFVRGMEFENVCIMVDAEEYFLKHFVPEAIGRCNKNLSLILLGKKRIGSKEETVRELVDFLVQQEPLIVEKWITEQCKICNKRQKYYCCSSDEKLIRVGIHVFSDKFEKMRKEYVTSNEEGGTIGSVNGAEKL